MALAVIAIGLAAAINAVSSATSTSIYLKEKTFAEWVAMNKVVELRLQRTWPAVGTSNGTAEMGDITWKWTLEVKTTPDASVRRLDVAVQPQAQKADAPTASVVAFLGKPT